MLPTPDLIALTWGDPTRYLPSLIPPAPAGSRFHGNAQVAFERQPVTRHTTAANAKARRRAQKAGRRAARK